MISLIIKLKSSLFKSFFLSVSWGFTDSFLLKPHFVEEIFHLSFGNLTVVGQIDGPEEVFEFVVVEISLQSDHFKDTLQEFSGFLLVKCATIVLVEFDPDLVDHLLDFDDVSAHSDERVLTVILVRHG